MSPNDHKVDLRIRRTRGAVREAFLGLIEEKGFEAIIVQDIADRAMINRVTFYKHYRDKYDLLEHTMQEFLDDLAGPVETLIQTPDAPAVYDALVRWLEHVARYASFYRTMLGKDGNAAFAAKLRNYLEAMVLQEVRRVLGAPVVVTPEGEIGKRFIAAGFLGVTEWWLDQKQPLPARDVATRLHRLLDTIMESAKPK